MKDGQGYMQAVHFGVQQMSRTELICIVAIAAKTDILSPIIENRSDLKKTEQIPKTGTDP